MNLTVITELRAGVEETEMAGIPTHTPSAQAYVEKQGTLFCIRSTNPQDKNFGCFSSREEAEQHLQGFNRFFNIQGYGTSEGVKKAWDTRGRKGIAHTPKASVSQITNRYKILGNKIEKAHKKLEDPQYVKSLAGKMLHLIKDLGNWSHGIDFLTRIGMTLYLAAQSNVTQHIMQTLVWAHAHLAGMIANLSQLHFGVEKKRRMPNPHGPSRKPNPSFGHGTALGVKRPNISLRFPGGGRHRFEAADWGEPMTGNMGHAHIDPIVWFRPPSLTMREKNNKARIPTDDPRETNDRFLDVTKRNSKDTKDQRMKILKRSGPGGLPPQVPVRTTLVNPHMAVYMPSSMFSARKRKSRGSAVLSYGRRGVL